MIGEAAAGHRVCIGTLVLNVNGFLFDCIGEFNFGGWFFGARAEHRQPDNFSPQDLAVAKGRESRKESQGDWCGPCPLGAGEREFFKGNLMVMSHILPQARGVLAMDGGTSSDPYCKVNIIIL